MFEMKLQYEKVAAPLLPQTAPPTAMCAFVHEREIQALYGNFVHALFAVKVQFVHESEPAWS